MITSELRTDWQGQITVTRFVATTLHDLSVSIWAVLSVSIGAVLSVSIGAVLSVSIGAVL